MGIFHLKRFEKFRSLFGVGEGPAVFDDVAAKRVFVVTQPVTAGDVGCDAKTVKGKLLEQSGFIIGKGYGLVKRNLAVFPKRMKSKGLTQLREKYK